MRSLQALALLSLVALGCASPAAARDICSGQPTAMQKACREAHELLMSGGTGKPEPALTIKATGSAQGWRFDYWGPGASVQGDDCRVAGPLTLPAGIQVRLPATATDKIHELKAPALGLDLTGIPGRINEVNVSILEPGRFRSEGAARCAVEVNVLETRAFEQWRQTWIPQGCRG